MSRLSSFSRFFLLAVASSALASCDMLGITSPFGADNPQKQEVEGPRRVPALNEPYLKVPATPPAVSAPAAAPAPAPEAEMTPPSPPAFPSGAHASMDSDPYDYYDGSGEPAPQPEAPSQSGHSDFFSRLFGSSSSNAAQNDQNVRKPLPENPYYPNDVAPAPPPAAAAPAVATAPETTAVPRPIAPPLPWHGSNAAPSPDDSGSWMSRHFVGSVSQLQTDIDKPVPTDETQTLKSSREYFSYGTPYSTGAGTAENDPPPAHAAAAAEKSSSPSWLGRLFGEKDNDEDAKATANVPTPKLSSVPAVPPQFQAVKGDTPQDMQQLENDRTAAERSKQDLDSEPSGLNAAPVDTSGSGGQTSAAPAPVAPDAAASPETTPQEEPPVLLGHAAAPLNPSAGESSDASGTLSVPPFIGTTPPVAAVGYTPPANANVADTASEPPVVQPATADRQPLLPQQQEMPSSNAAPQDNASGAALPSPQLLETDRALPPSRYSTRDSSAQQPAASY